MPLDHFFIPASSTIQGSLSLGCAGCGGDSGGLRCTSDACGASVSIPISSVLIIVELVLILATFTPLGHKAGGTGISDGSAVLPAKAARLPWEDLEILLSALGF